MVDTNNAYKYNVDGSICSLFQFHDPGKNINIINDVKINICLRKTYYIPTPLDKILTKPRSSAQKIINIVIKLNDEGAGQTA